MNFVLNSLILLSVFHSGDTIENYYKQIYLAEGKLISANYKESCRLYKEAFLQKTPFFADLRNSLRAAQLAHNEAEVIYFWKIVSSYPDVANEQKTLLAACSWLSPGTRRLIKDYNRKRVVTVFERTLDSIHIIDQQARLTCPRNNDQSCKKNFKAIDSSNIRAIAYLLKSTKYNESLYGEQSLNTCFLIAWHARRWGFTDLDVPLYDYLKAGAIKPILLAQLINYRSDNDTINKLFLSNQPNLGFDATSIMINNHLIEMIQDDSVLSNINGNREKYYMDDIKNDVGKQALTLRVNLFKNKLADLTVGQFVSRMGEEEYTVLLNDLLDKKIVKKVWYKFYFVELLFECIFLS